MLMLPEDPPHSSTRCPTSRKCSGAHYTSHKPYLVMQWWYVIQHFPDNVDQRRTDISTTAVSQLSRLGTKTTDRRVPICPPAWKYRYVSPRRAHRRLLSLLQTATGIGILYSFDKVEPEASIFVVQLGHWITAFFSMTFATNVICTGAPSAYPHCTRTETSPECVHERAHGSTGSIPHLGDQPGACLYRLPASQPAASARLDRRVWRALLCDSPRASRAL